MKAPSLDALEDKVLMGTNYFKMAARLLAPRSKNVFQMRDNRQFRQLMGTIDKVKSHIEGLLSDMIFYIACNERIRSGGHGIIHEVSSASANDGNLKDRLLTAGKGDMGGAN